MNCVDVVHSQFWEVNRLGHFIKLTQQILVWCDWDTVHFYVQLPATKLKV